MTDSTGVSRPRRTVELCGSNYSLRLAECTAIVVAIATTSPQDVENARLDLA
jgi:hypothetical protein